MNSASFQLDRDAQHRLVLRRPGLDDAVDVKIRRAFPWSSAGRFISIRSAEGTELMLIEDLAALEPQQRQAIETAMSSANFIPRIERVHEMDMEFGFQQWSVTTDRGPAEFRVQEREDVRFLPDGRFSIKDADGNVYELPRLDSLDEHSQKKVEPLI